VAYQQGKPVGRIGAIINHAYNEKTNTLTGRFTRAEFPDDPKVSSQLFAAAIAWVKEQGMTEIQGPLGFTNLDHQGMLVEGFEYLASVASEYHLPYYQDHLVNLGFTKKIDWIEFRLFLEGIPEKVKRVSELLKKRNGFTTKSFTKSSELRPYGKLIFDILNEAYQELFSVVKLDEEMIDYYVNRYIFLLNPEFVKLIFDQQDDLVGFIIGLPSLSEGLQKANGSLFPFGWYHIRRALKKPKVVDLMLAGVLPEYQGKGVTGLLMYEIQSTMEKYQVTEVETTGIFETNDKAIRTWKNFNHIQHKRKRCWRKEL
jgi:GNAT superfamily N-acetyltransferase